MGTNQIASVPVLFFHGFWGQASDWDFLAQEGFSKSFESISYTTEALLSPENFLSDWGQNFLTWKRKKFGTEKVTAVGYSQGGRLLLQAFASQPEEFNQVILISTHPGLSLFPEKEARLLHDRKWALKFRKQAWPELQKEWDQQSVFGNQQSPKRNEADFNREVLALCFENWSLAHQQDFRSLINQNLHKMTIILGADDLKYVALYQEFLNDLSVLKIEKGAAHRVPFDQPTKLVEILNSII